MTEAWADARGVWVSRGYGRILQIADDVRRFDTTAESCLEIDRWTLSGAAEEFDRLEVRDGVLSMFERGGITRYDHDRGGAVPTIGTSRDPADPLWNFDVFWRAFAEQYAFFELRGVEWNELGRRLRPRAEGASPATLADVLAEAVHALADAHVELDLGDRTIWSGAEGERSLTAWWRREHGASATTGGFAPAMRQVMLDELGVRDARTRANDRLVVGRIDDATGYVAIGSMWGFADGDDPSQSDDARAAGEAIDGALGELAGTRSLVLDVRTNDGGWDAVSLAIASRFADRPRVPFTKRARDGDGFTERQAIDVEPAGARRHTGPVAVLTSGTTGSAAEIFALCMGVLPTVTTIGEPTRGITSDELEKHLPNGWVVTLSNERYETPAGDCYERVGIPPSVPLAPTAGESLTGYLRRGVEAATGLLAGSDGT